MVERSSSERMVRLAEELGAQLGRLKGAGPKITQFLSMVQLARPPEDGSPPPPAGARPDNLERLAG